MKPVSLSRPLQLEAQRTVPDAAGGFQETWVPVGTLWAELVAGAGREVAGEEFSLSSVPVRITVRSAPHGSESRPKAEQRFRDGARLFRIVAVAERDPAGRFLTCYAREEVPT